MSETTLGALAQSGVLSLGDGYRTKQSELTSSGFRIIRVADVRDGRISLESPDFVSADFERQIGFKRARSGDVLLTTKGTVGRVAIVPELDELAVYSPQLCWFRVHDASVVRSRFLAYWLQSDAFLAQSSYMQGNTDMAPYISLSDLRGAKISLPSFPEQQAIAEVLGALDDKIAANTALAATAEQLLRTEIDAFWLRSSDRSSTLSDFVELNPKVAVPLAESVAYIDMKRLPESGWSVDGFDYREPKGGARFRNGDTLLARITPCLENRKAGFVDHLPEGQAGVGSTEFIVLRARAGVAPPISFLLATATRFREHAIQHMVGTSGRQRVAASDLASFELPTPDPDWLKNFGSRAIAVFELVASRTLERRTLAATRDALLPQLMSGKLRVRDAEDLIVQAGV